MITAGIDCGAKNTKTVIMENGQIIGKGMTLTGLAQTDAGEKAMKEALKAADLSADAIDECGCPGAARGGSAGADG